MGQGRYLKASLKRIRQVFFFNFKERKEKKGNKPTKNQASEQISLENWKIVCIPHSRVLSVVKHLRSPVTLGQGCTKEVLRIKCETGEDKKKKQNKKQTFINHLSKKYASICKHMHRRASCPKYICN